MANEELESIDLGFTRDEQLSPEKLSSFERALDNSYGLYRKGDKVMKCDELIAYNVVATADVNPEVVDSLGCTEWTGYDKNDVDAAITELKARIHELESIPHTDNSAVIERLSNENERLKAKLESVQATAYVEIVDAGMENRKLKRALWLARAKAYRYIAELITGFNPDYVRNRKMFTPNNQKQKQMNSLEWARLMLKVDSKCRAKAEEYK